MEAGKRVANFFGASFELNPGWGFDGLSKSFKANGESMLSTPAGQAAARAATGKKAAWERNSQAFDELSRRMSLQLEAEAKRGQQKQKAAAKHKAASYQVRFCTGAGAGGRGVYRFAPLRPRKKPGLMPGYTQHVGHWPSQASQDSARTGQSPSKALDEK